MRVAEVEVAQKQLVEDRLGLRSEELEGQVEDRIS